MVFHYEEALYQVYAPLPLLLLSGLETWILTGKALSEAREYQIAEMAGLRTAFPCVPPRTLIPG